MPIDHLVVTTSHQLHWPLYLSIMASPAAIYPRTISESELKVFYTSFLFRGLRTQASFIAPAVLYNRMLSFAALHGIGATIQRFKLDRTDIKQAIDDLEGGQNQRQGCPKCEQPRSKKACLILHRVRRQKKSKESFLKFVKKARRSWKLSRE